MKNTILIFTIFLIGISSLHAAQNWLIVEEDNLFYLAHVESPKNIFLLENTDSAKIISVSQHPTLDHIKLIEVYAGAHGTSVVAESYNIVVYNKQTREFLGEFPYRDVVHENGIQRTEQHKWFFSSDSIKITFFNTDESEVIPLN